LLLLLSGERGGEVVHGKRGAGGVTMMLLDGNLGWLDLRLLLLLLLMMVVVMVLVVGARERRCCGLSR
jgi:hypothetical protein